MPVTLSPKRSTVVHFLKTNKNSTTLDIKINAEFKLLFLKTQSYEIIFTHTIKKEKISF